MSQTHPKTVGESPQLKALIDAYEEAKSEADGYLKMFLHGKVFSPDAFADAKTEILATAEHLDYANIDKEKYLEGQVIEIVRRELECFSSEIPKIMYRIRFNECEHGFESFSDECHWGCE